jgi:small subunit ribosomal protein S6
MRQYEAMYILDPALEDEQQTALVERFQTLVGTQGGEVQHVDRWERRRLAYEIQGRREGFYVVMNFRGTPAAEAELSRVFGITEGVLRHLITRMDERLADRQLAEAKAAAEAKARAQAEAQAAAEAAAAAAAVEAAAVEAEAAEQSQAAAVEEPQAQSEEDAGAEQEAGVEEATGVVEQEAGTEG